VRLALLHARVATLFLLRYPGFAVPTLVFPAMFFLFFASPARGAAATYALCSFAAFAVLGVAFFQFGVGIAGERASPWEAYLRTLPVSAAVRLLARLLSAALFAVASALVVVAAALATTDAHLSPLRWVELACVLLLGIVPFGCLGVALGYWASPRGALPAANLLYLGLAYGGGLWIRPGRLPEPVQAVSPYLPTRHLANALAGVARGSPWALADWVVLAAFSAAFALAAIVGYRRDEGERFR
jgi:ABC-2 type transport system permease protein